MARIFLKSGELAIGTKEELLVTVLGSCVSVCIYDRVKKIGGLTHYLLPAPSSGDPDAERDPYNYGTTAIPSLLKKLKEQGSLKQNLVAKIIGGAQKFVEKPIEGLDVSLENIAIARKLLASFGIPIVAEEVGGTRGRKVEFNTLTGEIRFKLDASVEPPKSSAPQLEKTPRRDSSQKKIKVLIVDDSVAIRKLIRNMIEHDPGMEVIGEAQDPLIAEEIRKKIRPDVITLDLHMPNKNGVDYLREYMAVDPVSTIIVTDCNLKDTGPVMDALESGAFDYMQKPAVAHLTDASEILISKIKAAAAVEMTKLVPTRKKNHGGNPSAAPESPTPLVGAHHFQNSIMAIGASTGGTEAIKLVLEAMPKDIPPILIVQHMPPGFTKSFADRLNELCPFQVKEAEDGEPVRGGCVYIAPGGKQMAVINKGAGQMIHITDDPPENRFKPSVDYLFRSFGKLNRVQKVAALLTGMGSDGALELYSLRKQGVHTIAQDESSSVVYGMPKVAIEMGAACEVKRLDLIADSMIGALTASKNHRVRA